MTGEENTIKKNTIYKKQLADCYNIVFIIHKF